MKFKHAFVPIKVGELGIVYSENMRIGHTSYVVHVVCCTCAQYVRTVHCTCCL